MLGCILLGNTLKLENWKKKIHSTDFLAKNYIAAIITFLEEKENEIKYKKQHL